MKILLVFLVFLQFSLSIYARHHHPKTIYINGVTTKVAWQKVTNGALPANAYAAFKNQNGPVYICQANVASGVGVGQVQKKQCAVADDNVVTKVDDFQILVSDGPVKWLSMKDMYKNYTRNTMGFIAKDSLPMQRIVTKNKYLPVIGGFTYVSRYHPQMNYICRGMHDVQIVIGAVSRNKCQLIVGDQLIKTDMYQILTIRSE